MVVLDVKILYLLVVMVSESIDNEDFSESVKYTCKANNTIKNY